MYLLKQVNAINKLIYQYYILNALFILILIEEIGS